MRTVGVVIKKEGLYTVFIWLTIRDSDATKTDEFSRKFGAFPRIHLFWWIPMPKTSSAQTNTQVYQLKHQVHQSPVSSNQQYHFLDFLVNNSVNNIPDNLTTTTVGMVFIGLYLSGDGAFSKNVLDLKSFKSIHEHPADTNPWPGRSFLHPIHTRLFHRTDWILLKYVP